jgi:uncharacterized membrane protein YuzA (DUF378 family)
MKNFMKWLNVAAFTVLLLGGLNYLFVGLFGFDVFGAIFGTSAGILGRIIYSIIGLSALLLLITVLARAALTEKRKQS